MSVESPRSTGQVSSRRSFLALLGAVAAGTGAIGFARAGRNSGADARRLFPRGDEFLAATESPVADASFAVSVRSPSAEVGSAVRVAARSTDARAVELALFRVGWNDGAGAELVAELGTTDASAALDDVAEFVIPMSWRSGLYAVALRPNDGAEFERLAPFVVTDRRDSAPVMLQIPIATYQAYNGWGGASLYDFNSPQGRAVGVGLDRPFDVFEGAGFLYYGDLHLIWWLEREGVAVTYASSLDTHHNPALMDGRRLFLSGFHDEYWSQQMRRHLEGWVGAGVNAAFFSSNNIYWQVDFCVDEDGHPMMMCDKRDGGPQGTFRRAGWPEHRLLGSAYESYRFPYGVAASDWVVANADHWLYDGTGLSDGGRIERLVGYEWDRLPGDAPGPGVTVVADSPLADGHRHHACVVTQPGGGTVFNAGTNYWPRLLLGGGHWEPDAAVARMTRNLIDRLG